LQEPRGRRSKGPALIFSSLARNLATLRAAAPGEKNSSVRRKISLYAGRKGTLLELPRWCTSDSIDDSCRSSCNMGTARPVSGFETKKVLEYRSGRTVLSTRYHSPSSNHRRARDALPSSDLTHGQVPLNPVSRRRRLLPLRPVPSQLSVGTQLRLAHKKQRVLSNAVLDGEGRLLWRHLVCLCFGRGSNRRAFDGPRPRIFHRSADGAGWYAPHGSRNDDLSNGKEGVSIIFCFFPPICILDPPHPTPRQG